jgi:hypothetical protein
MNWIVGLGPGTFHLRADLWWWGLSVVVGRPLGGQMGPMLILQVGPVVATYYARDAFAPPVEEVESPHGSRAATPSAP